MKTKVFHLQVIVWLISILLLITGYRLQAQNLHEVKIRTDAANFTFEQALKFIEQNTKFSFTYNKETLPFEAKVQFSEAEVSLYDLLYGLAKSTGVTFHRISNQIVIKKDDRNEKILVTDEESNSIEGKVVDAKTMEPLAYASVYLSGTTIGAMTNMNGIYKIKKMPSGTFSLVCSIYGYSNVVKPITFSSGIQRIDFALNERIITAKEITVTEESSSEWRRRLSMFTKEFLGESSNAKDCEILNPEIIDFEINNNTNELIASAQDPIIIINHSLGYKLKVYLKDFVWSRADNGGKYQIYPLFEELKSSDEKEINKWILNRAKNYLGSFRHFLKSCVEGNVYEEGYRLITSYVSSKWTYTDRSDILLNQKKINLDTLLYSRIKKNDLDIYCLTFDSLMQVVYLRQGEELNYKNYRDGLNGNASFTLIRGFNLKREKYTTEIKPYQSSWVLLPSGRLFFNRAGICSDDTPYVKKFAGYWAWKRVSDLLPNDYEYTFLVESNK